MVDPRAVLRGVVVSAGPGRDWHEESKAGAAEEAARLVGRTVTMVRPLTAFEARQGFGWDSFQARYGIVIVFDDNTIVVPMSDQEGNNSGVLAVIAPVEQESSSGVIDTSREQS